jgi:hypothetical protein
MFSIRASRLVVVDDRWQFCRGQPGVQRRRPLVAEWRAFGAGLRSWWRCRRTLEHGLLESSSGAASEGSACVCRAAEHRLVTLSVGIGSS